jgi:hypothetical protein
LRKGDNIVREVFADFARLGEWPGIGLSVPLGREDDPKLVELTDGERVLAVEPGELRAEVTARVRESEGFRYWFGVLNSRSDIQDISTESIAGR